MQSVNETLDMDMSPQPTKRRRSSILKPLDRRATTNRDSRTVSFNITKFLANEDMEITMMEIPRNETITSSIDMSMDATLVPQQESQDQDTLVDKTRDTTTNMATDTTVASTVNNTSINTTVDETMNMETSMTSISNTTCNTTGNTTNNTICNTMNNTSYNPMPDIHTSIAREISIDGIDEDTLYGAFHESNNLSLISTRTSGETLFHNMEALSDRLHKVDQEFEERRRILDREIEHVFKFYKHVVDKDDKYEFAIRMLGQRYNLWLWFKINPDTYPNEELNVKIGCRREDKKYYPLKDYAKVINRFTKVGREGYLRKWIINAQHFRRLLRKKHFGGYGLTLDDD